MLSPGSYAANRDSTPAPGDMLYRAAPDQASARLEKLLWRPGVVAFYEDPFFEQANQHMLFQRHGIATPRAFLATRSEPTTAYRLVVVGRQVVAAEAQASGNDLWRATKAPSGAVALALRAADAMRLEFGGVDLLEDRDGRLALVAMDYPCNFAALQTQNGIAIAKAMVDHLITKRGQGPGSHSNPYAQLNLRTPARNGVVDDTTATLTQQWSPSGMQSHHR